MATQNNSVLSRIRQPEYTGENRCMPCTITNVAIAIVATIFIAFFSPLLAPVAFGLFIASIYFRGYLVPGTPELTKRYFPDRVLRWFDKAPGQNDATLIGTSEDDTHIDAEPVLRNADVLEPTPDRADLQLTDDFDAKWQDRIEAVRGTEYESQLSQVLSADEDVAVDPDAIDVQMDDWSVTVVHDETPVALWPSEAALIADIAAAPLLRARLPEWENEDLAARGQLLHGVRVFLERCPTCGSDLALSEETVESCCRTAEVVTLTCDGCDSRLLEVEV